MQFPFLRFYPYCSKHIRLLEVNRGSHSLCRHLFSRSISCCHKITRTNKIKKAKVILFCSSVELGRQLSIVFSFPFRGGLIAQFSEEQEKRDSVPHAVHSHAPIRLDCWWLTLNLRKIYMARNNL